MDQDPEFLPRRLLTDFSIYNAEVRSLGGLRVCGGLVGRLGGGQRCRGSRLRTDSSIYNAELGSVLCAAAAAAAALFVWVGDARHPQLVLLESGFQAAASPAPSGAPPGQPSRPAPLSCPAPAPAQGLFASLELLPLWGGVDPDVELYASGRVVDDDGDFSGGQSLGTVPAAANEAGGSSAAAGGSSAVAAAEEEPAGMRLYLSQIREWVVDFGADMLFISIRTDVAW
jgi:hypothetical protein